MEAQSSWRGAWGEMGEAAGSKSPQSERQRRRKVRLAAVFGNCAFVRTSGGGARCRPHTALALAPLCRISAGFGSSSSPPALSVTESPAGAASSGEGFCADWQNLPPARADAYTSPSRVVTNVPKIARAHLPLGGNSRRARQGGGARSRDTAEGAKRRVDLRERQPPRPAAVEGAGCKFSTKSPVLRLDLARMWSVLPGAF